MSTSAQVKVVPVTAADVRRGVQRLLHAEGYASLVEFSLSNNRRMDVAGVCDKGTILGVEIKVSIADLKADNKWPDYIGYCDHFYFAVPYEFPQDMIPETTGLIVADRFGGGIVRPSPRFTVNATRRRALTIRFARKAAERLTRVFDPYCEDMSTI